MLNINGILIIVFSWFIWASCVYSQNPNFYVIGKEELSDSDVYSLLFDEESEILYAATSSGVYKYSQNRFSLLKLPVDAIGNSYFDLQQNSKGEIFCYNFNSQIFKLENDKFELYFSDSKGFDSRSNYYIDTNDDLIFVKSSAIWEIKQKGIGTDLMNENQELFHSRKIYRSSELQKGEIYIFGSHYSYYRLKEGVFKKFRSDSALNHPLIFNIEDELFIVNIDGSIVCSPDHIVNDVGFGDHINLVEVNGGFYSSPRTQGIRSYYFKNDTLKYHSILQDRFTSWMTGNDQGTLFTGTFKEGVKVIPKINQISFDLKNELLLDIVSLNDSVAYVCTRSGKVIKMQDDTVSVLNEYRVNVDKILYLPNFANLSNKLIASDAQKYKEGIVFRRYVDFAFDDLYQVSKTVFLISGNYQISLRDFSNNQNQNLYQSEKHIIAMEFDSVSGMVYVSATDGTAYFNIKDSDKKYLFHFREEPFVSNEIKCFGDTLIFATQNKGVLIFDPDNRMAVLDEEKGLNSNTVKMLDKRGAMLLILSGGKLQMYDLEKNKFIPLGEREGMGQNNVVSFSMSESKIWISENNRVYSISLNDVLIDKKIGLIKMDSIQVNGLLLENNIGALSYDENEVTFFFDYRNFETKNDIELQYKLEGFNSDWKRTNGHSNSLIFESLAPGSYTFRIKAVIGPSESEELTYSFVINKPIWNRWWFYLIWVGVFLLILVLLFQRRLRLQKKKLQVQIEKEQLSTSLAESQLKALRAQMNPHFIFNSLNSIQSLILKQDTDKSYDYVSQFADLVRTTLKHSEREFVLLTEELEFLKIYLSLESLRFGDDFEFIIDNQVKEEEILIPSLLIQPFIENALLHGLLHKKGVKILKISFSFDEVMKCVIDDNGVGREVAGQIKKRQGVAHESFSTKAINKRLLILSKKMNQEASFTYEDIMHDNSIQGTQTVVVLPYQIGYVK